MSTSELFRSQKRDKVYYNISIRPSVGEDEKVASFEEERNQPIVKIPNDYYLTLSRFSIPANNVPINVMDVIVNPSDPTDYNYTPYSVTLVYNQVIGALITRHVYKEQIIFRPDSANKWNFTIPLPPTATRKQQRIPYYYLYTYSHMMVLINETLAKAFLTMKSAFPAIPQTEPPVFLYGATTQLISLYTQYTYTNISTGQILPADPLYPSTSTTVPEIEIFASDKLFNTYIEAIAVDFFGRNNTDGLDFRFRIIAYPLNVNAYVKKGDTMPIPPLTPPYLRMIQEYKHLENWNSMIGLVFTSASLPIHYESVQSTETAGKVLFTPVLTDFEPQLNDAGSARGIMQYFSRGIYRVINMSSNTPLTKIDFKVWWKDKQGNLYPLIITYGQELSVKMLFIRRDTYKN